MPRNPVKAVPRLPHAAPELDYLRISEIDLYLDACAAHYRPLAELHIGAGARISEALALTWADVDLAGGTIRISRQRPRRGEAPVPTKGKRARSVHIGPGLTATLKLLRQDRIDRAVDDRDWLFLCPVPKRGRYARRTDPTPPNRKTVHDWHEAALQRSRAPRHAAARPSAHRRGDLAEHRTAAHLRGAATRTPVDHHDRGALRALGDGVHERRRSAD